MKVGRRWRRGAQEARGGAETTGQRAPARVLDFVLERFEYVQVDADQALLRIEGSWGSEAGLREPSLAVTIAGITELYESLPGAPALGEEPDTGLRRSWHAGYAVPGAIVTPEAHFALRSGGRTATLPLPGRRTGADAAGPAEDAAAEQHAPRIPIAPSGPNLEQIAQWWAEDAERHVVAIDALTSELETERAARADLYAEAGRLNALESGQEAEIAALRADVEQRDAETQQRDVELARLGAELDSLRAALQEARAEQDRARSLVDEHSAGLVALRTEAAETARARDDSAAEANARAEELSRLEARLAAAEERARIAEEGFAEVSGTVEAGGAERAELERQLEEARVALSTAAAEHDETRTRLEAAAAEAERSAHERAQLDARIVAAEQGVRSAEEHLVEVAGALEARGAQRAELERRLEEAQAALSAVAAERDRMNADAEQARSELDGVRAELEGAAAEVGRSVAERARLDAKLAEFEELAAASTERIAQLEREREQVAAEHEHARAELERELGTHAWRVDELESALAAAGDQGGATMERIAQLELELEQARESLLAAATEHEQALGAAAADRDQAMRAAATKQAEARTELERALEGQTASNADLDRALTVARSAFTRAEAEHDQTKAELERLAAEVETHSSERAQLRSRIADAQEKTSAVEQRLAAALEALQIRATERDQLERELTAARAGLEQAGEEAERSSQERVRIETLLAEAEGQARTNAGQLAEATKDLEKRLAKAEEELRAGAEQVARASHANEARSVLEAALAEARTTLESQTKRIGDLERRYDDALVGEEQARAQVAQAEAVLIARENDVIELRQAGEQARQWVAELESQLAESREALRRGVRERLWETQS